MPVSAPPSKRSKPGPPPLRVLAVHGADYDPSLPPALKDEWWGMWKSALDEAAKWSLGGRALQLARFEYASSTRVWNEVIPSRVSRLADQAPRRLQERLRQRHNDVFAWPERYLLASSRVGAWTEDAASFRSRSIARFRKQLAEYRPHVVVAHSLGSLIAYAAAREDLFPSKEAVQVRWEDITLVTFGSQLFHPEVRLVFGGSIRPAPYRQWFNLHNEKNDILAQPFRVPDHRFHQISTPFALAEAGVENAAQYCRRTQDVWRQVARDSAPPPPRTRTPRQRALLVGINDYPDERMRLEGCVNDVFLVSGLLRRNGFGKGAGGGIHTLLNGRATAARMRQELDWLFKDALPGDDLILYYSGHGAALPGLNSSEKVDGRDECLVPVDFDWSLDRAIIDDDLFDGYSQLPFEVNLTVVLDCCHAGGLTRDGGRVRGLTPPEDLRHHLLDYGPSKRASETTFTGWRDRRMEKIQQKFTARGDTARQAEFVGEDGATYRLGASARLRRMKVRTYEHFKRLDPANLPFMPVILQACREGESAREHYDGAICHGVFTFALEKILKGKEKGIDFRECVARVRGLTEELGYSQSPGCTGPSVKLKKSITWV